MREAATICPAPCKLTFDLLALKVVSESRVTWATSMPILVFLRPICSRLRPDIRDRQTDVRRASSLNAPATGAGHNKYQRQLEGYTAYRSGVTRTAHAMACVTCTVVYTPMGLNGFIRKITPPTLLWAVAHFTYLTASGKIYPAFACRPPQTSIPRAWSVDERLIYYNTAMQQCT